MQDLEFTIQDNILYMLQTRSGKRTALAAVNIAVDMVNEELINKREGLLRVQPQQLGQFLHKQLDPNVTLKHHHLGRGLPASPGAAIGRIAFDNESRP